MRRPDVLVVGTSVDPHIAAVLEQSPPQADVCRLDIDRFPTGFELTVRPGKKPRLRLETSTDAWVLDDVPVAWFRRLGQPGLDERVTGGRRAFALGEIEQTLTGALDLLRPGRWINEYWAARRAAIKLWQYEAIIALGIPFADVIVTNSGAAVREWSERRPVIFKSLHSPLVVAADDSSPARFVFTSPVTAGDLDDDEAIRLAPCQFQQRVEAAYELRITTVGKRHFAVRIDHDPWPPTDTADWRAHPDRIITSEAEIDAEISDQLDRLFDLLGIQYGASDWLVEPNGRHVLLEVNPHGSWLWLENEIPDLGITAAVANALFAPG
jgi:hypothetical protein